MEAPSRVEKKPNNAQISSELQTVVDISLLETVSIFDSNANDFRKTVFIQGKPN